MELVLGRARMYKPKNRPELNSQSEQQGSCDSEIWLPCKFTEPRSPGHKVTVDRPFS